jgi:ATP synthase protein I
LVNWQNNALTKTGRKLALMQLLIMSLAVLTCTLVTYFFWGDAYALSAIAGGVIGIIPNCVFAYKAFKFAGAQASQQVMKSFYSGAKLKLGLTALLFALAFKFLVIIPVPFFGAFCLVVVIPLLTPMFLKI